MKIRTFYQFISWHYCSKNLKSMRSGAEDLSRIAYVKITRILSYKLQPSKNRKSMKNIKLCKYMKNVSD